MAAEDAGKKAMEHGMRTLEIEVKGRLRTRIGIARLTGRWLRRHLDSRRTPIPHNAAVRRSVGAFERAEALPAKQVSVARIRRRIVWGSAAASRLSP